MQSYGWLYALLPRWRQRQEHEICARLRQANVHFNTHPFFAPLMIGAAVSNQLKEPLADARRLIAQWMGTFGALGDLLYWRIYMMHVSWLAVLCYALWSVTGMIVFAGIILVFELGARYWLFQFGRRHPERLGAWVRRFASLRLRERLETVGLYAICTAAGFAFALFYHQGPEFAANPKLGVPAMILGALFAARTPMRSAVLWSGVAVSTLAALLE